jgi:hypothetical protein
MPIAPLRTLPLQRTPPLPDEIGGDGSVLILPMTPIAGQVKDLSGYNNHGTIYGAVEADGRYGKCLSFDGVDDYVEVPSDPHWMELNGKDLTTLIWFNSITSEELTAQAIGTYSTLSATAPVPNQAWQIQVLDTGKPTAWLRRDNNAETVSAVATTVLSPGTFYQLGFVKRGLDVEIWVNSIHEATATLSQEGNTDNDQELRMPVSWATFLNCIIDAVRIYNRALSAEEIKAHYLGGRLTPLRSSGVVR